MCSGIEFVKRIDDIISELNISRKDFCEAIGINPSTMATWKTRNILPPVETIEKIAANLNVSIEWLLFGTPFYFPDETMRGRNYRIKIRNKIYKILASKLNKENADNEADHNSFFKSIPEVSYKVLLNWSKGIINLDLYLFEDIAFALGVSFDYLLTDSEELPKNIDSTNPIDKNIYETALRNLNDLFCLDNLTDERRKLAKDMLNQLMKLEHLEYVEKNKKAPQ